MDPKPSHRASGVGHSCGDLVYVAGYGVRLICASTDGVLGILLLVRPAPL